MFTAPNPKQSFPELERDILRFWDEEKIFEETVNKDAPLYTFFDGPPFATGLPHHGHLLAGTIKDVVPRFWTMKGYRVPRRFGWDCHGLPVENLIETELGLKSKKEIEEYGIDRFNEACRASVLRYAEQWKKTVRRIGRWVDTENDYKTMNPEYMESTWWVFKQVWEKGLVYKGFKPMHICPRCETPLSNFEVTLGYKDITDISGYYLFPITTDGTFAKQGDQLIAWTTTAWSLPGNVGLAVHADITYARVRHDDTIYILAANRIAEVLGEDVEILQTAPGSTLVTTAYTPMFSYFVGSDIPHMENAFRVIAEEFVSMEDGTGIVSIAPAFGEDDMIAGKRHQLPFVQPVGIDGMFTSIVTDFPKEPVKSSDDPRKMDQRIVQFLEEQGRVLRKENFKHSYPHCWRCDTPLLNYAFQTWFVSVEQIKDRLLANNQQINWTPNHIRDGRFGKWLENARDWAISRNRFWGTPLPIWESEETNEFGEPLSRMCIGSVAELEQLTGTTITDLHKHHIDHLTFVHPDTGHTMRRTSEVFDCWFESGSMPYASRHYPFADTTEFDSGFPANFIAEGQDQTRGWFYTLHILSTILFDTPAFKNTIVNGMLLAADGKKLSKKLRNYTEPDVLLDQFGADALRFYLMHSPAVHAESLRVNDKDIEEVVKAVILPLWNTFSFFTTYANIDGWSVADKVDVSTLTHPLDRWIISSLHSTIQEVTTALEHYELYRATDSMYQFLDNLTNWYVRRSRRRFWKSENDGDKVQAYSTLHEVLVRFSQILAPFMPFVTEHIYQTLTGERSVHLSTWPTHDSSLISDALNEEIALTKTIVRLGHAARAKARIKVRQPLQSITVALPEHVEAGTLTSQISAITEELNIKEITFAEGTLGNLICKPNAKILGPRLGKEVQAVINAAKEGQFTREADGSLTVLGHRLDATEVELVYVSQEGENLESEQGIVLQLDTTITEALAQEGVARDIVRTIQDLRKEADLHVADRITVSLVTTDTTLQTAITAFDEYIKKETLADTISLSALSLPLAHTTLGELHIALEKK